MVFYQNDSYQRKVGSMLFHVRLIKDGDRLALNMELQDRNTSYYQIIVVVVLLTNSLKCPWNFGSDW